MKFDKYLMSFVIKDLEKSKVPMLVGEPGIGKSSWCEALAASMAKPTKCFTLAVNQLADKADLTGARLVPVDPSKPDGRYKQVFFPHERIMNAVAYAESHPHETPLLLLDEINRTTADVTSAALSIPTMRSIGSVELPSNLRVIIAGNDKGNITSLDTASISRFVLYRVEPDTQTFLEVEQVTINPYVKTVLERNPELIFCKTLDTVVAGKTKDDNDDDKDTALMVDEIIMDSEGMSQITTPRTIKAVSDWLNGFEASEILQMATIPAMVDGVETNLFMEGVVGHCGYTQFAVNLVNEVMANINTLSANTAAKGPKKPACYNKLKTQPDIDALQEYIGTLNDAEKSACIVYAICEKADNTAILLELCKGSALIREDSAMLFTQVGLDAYDVENLNVVLNSDTDLARGIKMFL